MKKPTSSRRLSNMFLHSFPATSSIPTQHIPIPPSFSVETLYETTFYCQHRPLAFQLYNESGSLFGRQSSIFHKSQNPVLDPWEDITEMIESPQKHPSSSRIDVPVQGHIMDAPAGSPSDSVLAINILKIRRKKMNRHKLRKRRRKLRFDTRYNREMQKRKKKAIRRRPFDPNDLEENAFKDFKREV